MQMHSSSSFLLQVGAFQPILPADMAHLLDAPTPLLVGISHLPRDFEQDDRTVVVLLDRETVRIRHSGLEAPNTGHHCVGALESHADVLMLQLPGNSALYHQLEPLAALLRTGSGSGSGVAVMHDPTVRPCYRPTPTQVDACRLLGASLCCYVRGLLRILFASTGTGTRDATRPGTMLLPPLALCRAGVMSVCSEPEAPFWEALLSTQMLAYFIERQNDLAQAQTTSTHT